MWIQIACIQALNHFVQLLDDSKEVPDLKGKKLYADFKLNRRDWEQIEKVHKVLQVSDLSSFAIMY
jgi:hypothetical protein